MAQITGEIVRMMARDMFDYEISPADAEGMAHTAGAMLTLARHLCSLGLSGVEVPFGYPVLTAEAARIAKK